MNWDELKNQIPNHGFAEKYDKYRRIRPTTTLIVLRTVTDPILFRNTDPERAETQVFKEVLHAQVNGEKFVSKERLTGLNLCRELDKNVNIIHKQYTYNEPLKSLIDSQTADMLTYGLAGTVTGATFSQKSHVIEGYTYSLEPYELMNKETHNALYESGTMLNESGKQSESFFHPVKIQPGTHFVHFVTLEAGTKEMLLYIIHNILNTGRYGARETRTGRNIRNEVIGLITSSNDSSLSCGELICEQLGKVDNNLKIESIRSAIFDYVNAHKKSDWQIYWSSNFCLENPDGYPGWLLNLIKVGERKSQGDLELLASALEIIRKQGLDVVEKNEFLLKEKDIIDPIELARRLFEEKSSLSIYIKDQLSSDTISLAESDEGHNIKSDLGKSLSDDLNKIIDEDNAFYDENRFGQITLSDEIRALIESNQEDDVPKLNRLLLETAYPQEIKKNQKKEKRQKNK